ncbi:MAG: spore maturation protein A [Ruminococcus sp.]|nr:spore maturation protein A [Ruminococcus sp.]
MLGILIVILTMLSIVFGIKNGTLGEVSAASIDSCTKAVELTVYLAGSMALWGGLMRVAEKSGITAVIERLIMPVAKRIFKGLDRNPKAAKAVCMNITANLLGLGNASTPLGIEAAKALSNPSSDRNSKRNIAMLVVLNTTSIQLIPATVGAMRMSHGAASPFDITLPVLIVSILSAAAGCITVYALYITGAKKNEI